KCLLGGICMEDQEFISGFENCTLTSFHHRDHVKLAWLYLRSYPVLEALARFTSGIKNFAKAHGKSNLYHETITWAYIFLIHERMARGGESSWEEFAVNNSDLLNWQENILASYYSKEMLQSEMARKVFVFPDKPAKSK